MRRSRERGWAVVPVVVVVVLLGLGWWLAPRVLRAAGTFLNTGEAPRRADAVVVLAGGWRGERVMKAVELVRAGYAGKIYLSDGATYYGMRECEAEREFAVRAGAERGWFECLATSSGGTKAEAESAVPQLRAKGLKRVLVVSVETHLRRAGRIFRQVGPEFEWVLIAARTPEFRMERWYAEREGWKAVILEWTKLVTEPFGI